MKDSLRNIAFPVLAAPSALAVQEPGLFEINTGLSIWTLIVFGALLLILAKYAWGPILKGLESRERSIQDAIDRAARLEREAADALEQSRRRLGEARKDAQQIIAEAKEAAARVERELLAKARQESTTLIRRARREIDAERDAALESIRKEAVGVALAAASRLVQARLDAPADRRLVTRYLSSLGGSGAGKGHYA